MPMNLRRRKLPAGFWKGSTTRPKVARKARITNKRIAKIAKNVVSRAAETKYVAAPVTAEGPVQIWAATNPVGGVPQLYDVFPGLAEGSGEFQRQGTKVSPTRHTVDVELAFNNLRNDISGGAKLDTCSWDITAHIWYGYVRRYKNTVSATTNAVAVLSEQMEDGQGNTSFWDGSPAIDQLRLNTEVLQMKHKAIRLYRPLGSQNTATLAGGLTTYFPQKISTKCTLSFKPPKTLLFDELQGVPQNYAPIMIVAYKHNDYTPGASISADGPSVLSKPALMMYARTHMWYKDL